MIVLFPLIGFWFWAVWVVSACWLFSAVYSDHYFQASVDVVALLVLLSITGNIHLANCWQYVLHNPVAILGSALAYLGVGVVWSMLKWRLMLRRFKRQLAKHWESEEAKATGASHSRTIPYSLERKGLRLEQGKVRLEVDNFKTKIIGWMTYWWVSMPVWLLGDALHELFETLYLSVRRFYQRMADSALND
jgi:uncharacterized membrane protein